MIPQEPLIVARLVTYLLLCNSMLSQTPGCRFRTRLYRARRMACAQNKRIGTIPKFFVLGAMLQIQGYTLHLVTRVLTPFKIKYLQSFELPSG